jgi:hypothetical protein
MIVFDLQCRALHIFEAWFDNSSAYERQKKQHMIACPICEDTHIAKVLSAPNVSAKSNQRTVHPKTKTENDEKDAVAVSAPADLPTSSELKDLMGRLADLQEKVEASHEDVGDTFPEEVRKIHYGESAVRPIYGDATPQEAQDLQEEGIEILPLPFKKKRTRRLDA